MPRRAQLFSIDAVATLAAAVETFHGEAQAALEELELEIRRALEWIGHDRKDYWNRELRRGWERTAEARVQLQQGMTFRRVGNEPMACVDEKKALEQAKRRLELAQQQVEAVRHWSYAVERAVRDYRAARSSLANWLDADCPRAVAALRRMTETLQHYVAMEVPPDPSAAVQPPAAEKPAEAAEGLET
jgi:hypothetical protein